MKINIKILMRYLFVLIFLPFWVFGQSEEIKQDFSRFCEQANVIITKNLAKEIDPKIADKISIGMDESELKNSFNGKFPNNVKIIIDIEKKKGDFKKKLTGKIRENEKLIDDFCSAIIALVPNESKNPKRFGTIAAIKADINKLALDLKTSFNTTVSTIPPKINITNIDSLESIIQKFEKRLPSTVVEVLVNVAEWWDYIFWGVITLICFFISFAIFISLKIYEIGNSFDGIRNVRHTQESTVRPNYNTSNLSMSNIDEKIRKAIEPLQQKLSELQLSRPYESTPVPIEIVEEKPQILYSESPEQDGWFLSKNNTPQVQRRSLYKIVHNKKTNALEFELLFDNIGGHRFAMNSARTSLQPACEYKDDPKPSDQKIVANGGERGVLKDIGNGKLQIIKKIKIKFQ